MLLDNPVYIVGLGLLTVFPLLMTIISSTPSYCDTFECDSDKCLTFYSVCDGVNDCLDGTDEGVQCRSATIECVGDTEFLCNDGQCILNDLRCDGTSDCVDESDELNCDIEYEHPFCKEFTCDEDQMCLPLVYLCDGVKQCTDGSDEEGLHCSSLSMDCTNVGEFMCRNGHCIPNIFRCDGSADCTDTSDEDGCFESNLPVNCTNVGEFMCHNGHCIPNIFRCDGSVDCTDTSDEDGCFEKEKSGGVGTTAELLTSLRPSKVKTTSSTVVKSTAGLQTLTVLKRMPTVPTDRVTSLLPSITNLFSPTVPRKEIISRLPKSTSQLLFMMTSSKLASPPTATEVNIIRQPSSKEDNSVPDDVGTFRTNALSNNTSRVYGSTAAAIMVVGTLVFITVLVIRRRKQKKPIIKTSVHFVNPYYGSA